MKTVTVLFLSVLFAGLAFGDVINVPGNQPTIQTGIDAAVKGDTVLVAENTYYENINFKGKAITVASLFLMDQDTSHISKTIIDGSQPSHADSGSVVIFKYGEDTTSIICGFTITCGTGTEWPEDPWTDALRAGGGILLQHGGARICNNIIKNNSINNEEEAFGGGIAGGFLPDNKWVIIEENTIYENSLTSNNWTKGGGMALGFCNIKIKNNIVWNNTVTGNSDVWYAAAGGIWYSTSVDSPRIALIDSNIIIENRITQLGNRYDGAWASGLFVGGSGEGGVSAIIRNNIIKHNESYAVNAAYGNGVLFNGGESIEFSNNKVISNNYNALDCYGGGVCILNCHPNLINNIVSKNSATYGGGIYVGYHIKTYPHIINNTIVKNSATKYGGGIYCRNSKTTIINTIFWENMAPSSSQIHNHSSTIDVAYSDIQGGWPGAGNIDVNPLFADTLFHLSDSSMCIGRGIDSLKIDDVWYYCPSDDIEGTSRPYLLADEYVDIGVYESKFPKITAIFKDESPIPYKFILYQNYPNPFNPKTTISYQLLVSSSVEISIYNILGQKVATLVSNKQKAGTYKVEWDATKYASGLYFYRLSTNKGYVQTKKLIVLK